MNPLVLVYTDHPMCSIDCADAVVEVLNGSGLYDARMFGPSSYPELKFCADNLSLADCVVFPGGMGDADQFDEDLINHKHMIQDYIAQGGKYLGICQGSYFASKHYFNILTNVVAQQHIKRKGSSTKRTGPAIVPLMWWKDPDPRLTYFHDGATFITEDNSVPTIMDVLACYANEEPAAIIQPYERGKVGVIGPHPEAQKWWFYSQSQIREGWKLPLQHEILLDLMEILLQ